MIDLNYVRELPDDELYALSLEKDEKGRFTHNSNMAYYERKRRNGTNHWEGVSKTCYKYRNDLDYYGTCERY